MKISVLIIFIFISAVILHSEDNAERYNIVFKNGSTMINVKIVEDKNGILFIEMENGEKVRLNLPAISIIENVGYNDYEYEVPDEKQYTIFGGTFGTPALVNLDFGRWMGPVGIRLSGMYWGDWATGFEFNFGIKLIGTQNVLHSVNIQLGHFNSTMTATEYTGHYSSTYEKYSDWTYFGPSYNVNYYGLNGQLGLSIGTGDYSNPQVMFKIGYVHMFN